MLQLQGSFISAKLFLASVIWKICSVIFSLLLSFILSHMSDAAAACFALLSPGFAGFFSFFGLGGLVIVFRIYFFS